jgi:putative redox protein
MIKIKHLNDHLYEATNGRDTIKINPDKYPPTDLFITGLGNCSAYDVVALAKNRGSRLENFTLEVEYKRKNTFPRIFTEFHFIYMLETDEDAMTVKRWVLSSLETYCSTINTIRYTSKIYYTIISNGETVAYKESILSGEANNTEEFDDDDGFGCIA